MTRAATLVNYRPLLLRPRERLNRAVPARRDEGAVLAESQQPFWKRHLLLRERRLEHGEV